MKNTHKTLLENVKERNYLGDPGIGGRIILKWVLEKFDMKGWTCSL